MSVKPLAICDSAHPLVQGPEVLVYIFGQRAGNSADKKTPNGPTGPEGIRKVLVKKMIQSSTLAPTSTEELQGSQP